MAVIVGAFSLIISAGGLFMLWRSLLQTMTAISNDRTIGHAQVRAYLSVDIPSENFRITTTSTVPVLQLRIKNTGQSPARRQKHVAGAFAEGFPLQHDDSDLVRVYEGEESRGTTLGAGGWEDITATPDDALTLPTFMSAVKDETQRVYVAGIIWYDDVFDTPHRTRFCAYLDRVSFRDFGDGTIHEFRWTLTDQHNDET